MSPRKRHPLTIEHGLLGFLRQRPMYGYEIHQQWTRADGLGQVWHLKQGLLYALLARLEQEGLVTATLEPQETRPFRKVYQLTPAGQAAFLEWVASPVPHGRQLRLEFLVKLYFARREGEPVVQQLLARQRATCRGWLAGQQARVEALSDAHSFHWLVAQFRRGQIEAMLQWLDGCQQTWAAHPDEPEET